MFSEKVLSNGIKFYAEQIPALRSAAVGIWVKAGSATEEEAENGYSHFLEHMFFKGTKTRNYREIAEQFDNIGVQTNAYTSKEMTCYYVRALDEKLPEAIDILTDMFCNSTFPEEEVDKERGVILEEIAMTLDTPDSLLMEHLTEQFFAGTELSRTILGPAENIQNADRAGLVGYHDRHYIAENIIIAAVGNFNEEKLLAQLEERMGTIARGGREQQYLKREGWAPAFNTFVVERDIEQAHLGMAFQGPSIKDNDRYMYSIAVNILGGGLSSRLFQRVREEMGAAYSVYAYPSIYCEAGMIMIYAGTSPDKVDAVVDAILDELKKMKTNGITQDELEHTKVQLAANYVLGQENSSSRMNLLGRNALLLGRPQTESEVLEKIAAITMEDMEALFKKAFDDTKMVRGIVRPSK